MPAGERKRSSSLPNENGLVKCKTRPFGPDLSRFRRHRFNSETPAVGGAERAPRGLRGSAPRSAPRPARDWREGRRALPTPAPPPRSQSGPRARQGWGGWKPCPLEGLVRGATRYGGRRRKKRGIPLGPPPPRRSPAGQINTTNDFTQHNRMAEFNASSFPFPSTGLGFKNKKMR